MGLLDLLLGKKKKERSAPAAIPFDRVPTRVKVRTPPQSAKWQALPQGSYEAKAYIYDGIPLLKIPDNEVFNLTLVLDPPSIASAATGTVYTTSEGSDDIGLAYGGYLVGFLSVYDHETVIDYAKEADGTVVYAVRQGNYMKGIPSIKVSLPSRDWFFARRHGLMVDPYADFTTIHIPDTYWTGKRLNGKAKVKLELIPTPKGSQAKPHIRLIAGGSERAEITAKSLSYKPLLELLDKDIECVFSRYQKYMEVEGGKHVLTFVLKDDLV